MISLPPKCRSKSSLRKFRQVARRWKHCDSPDTQLQWRPVHCAKCKAQIVNNSVVSPKAILDISELHCCKMCEDTGGKCHQFGCRQPCASPKLCGGTHGPVYCHLINVGAVKPGAMDEISDHDIRKTHLAKLTTTGSTSATTSFRMCQSAYSQRSPTCGQECTAMQLSEEDNNTDAYLPCRTKCAYVEGHMFQSPRPCH